MSAGRALALCLRSVAEAHPLPMGLIWQPAGHALAVIAAAPLGADQAQAHLSHCLALHSLWPGAALLPFAPRSAPALRGACGWAATHEAPLTEALSSLAGRGEMIVTLEQAAPAPEVARSGRAYLQARHARHRQRLTLEAQLGALLPEALPLSPKTRALPAPAHPLVAEVAALLPLEAMADTAADLHRACPPDLALRASGPWPAFAHAAALTQKMAPMPPMPPVPQEESA